ncbi:Panacea domain-containing protein [Tenacibaculum ovolyticum]|uniref:Panacea domain-containing protein n=1 Tax=Tenacibaculum ovolyticum TaxID=104270 RepID=UPI001F4489FA|nr:type II toxin-antitoxin system antitoxin SocA domain-containing protein [Tenacibaculum ovolyticum]
MGTTSSVVNEFIKLAKKTDYELTNMKLIKLMYISQGLSLSLLERPLFENDAIEAWKFGPVIPSVYHEFKHFKSSPITTNSVMLDDDNWQQLSEPTLNNEEDQKIVLLTWQLYRDITAKDLVDLTHMAGTPWSLTYRPGHNIIINNNLIKRYYDRFIMNLDKQLKSA